MYVYSIIQSPSFILAAIISSFIVKIYLLTILIPHGLRSKTIHKPWLFLLGVLTGSMFGDIAWIVKLVRDISVISLDYSVLIFFVRLSWSFLIIQYQALALFIESLTEKKFTLNLRHTLLLIMSISFALFFFYEAFFDTNLTDRISRNEALSLFGTANAPFEIKAMQYVSFYLLQLLMIPHLISTFWNLYRLSLPTILKKQVKIIMLYFICPYLLIEALQAAQFIFPMMQNQLYPIVACSTILITCATSYCIRKIMGLRFLNFQTHVQTTYNREFINNFKNLLEQFSHTNSIQELNALTQTFFHESFGIAQRKTTLSIYPELSYDISASSNHSLDTQSIISNFLHTHHDLTHFIKQRRILIYDEIEFTNFYDENDMRKTALTFLENLNADIFLPIYEQNSIIAYIIVEHSSHKKFFYGNSEQDEMLVFSRYLGSIINLLRHRNLAILLHKEKELKEEVQRKHQEISQYQESIKSFLRDSNHAEMGIIFYKNRRFIFGNKAAKNLIAVNPNTHEGHPTTKTLKNLIQTITTYNTPQTCAAFDGQGEKIMLYGVPTIENNTIMVVAYYPELSDLITKKLGLLKDPTEWDYLLYLETTQSGQLINQLIPDSGEIFLNFKINLLKTALSQKAILLDMPEEDLMPTVEIIHHISLREKFHVLTLKKGIPSSNIAIQLFGISPLFDPRHSASPLLETLNNGTLFIKNIEYLDHETQSYLVEFLKYGVFCTFKGDKKTASHVRIICSTQQKVSLLRNKGIICQELFDELNNTSLVMPSLETLPEQELNKLADGLTQQAIKRSDLHNVLSLTDKEKSNIADNRPVSLHKLKIKIQELIAIKTRKTSSYDETHINQVPLEDDPEVLTAVQMGKKALRDQQIMALLWNKFKNQNKIAMVLGVNRSSINRRCKEYNLK